MLVLFERITPHLVVAKKEAVFSRSEIAEA